VPTPHVRLGSPLASPLPVQPVHHAPNRIERLPLQRREPHVLAHPPLPPPASHWLEEVRGILLTPLPGLPIEVLRDPPEVDRSDPRFFERVAPKARPYVNAEARMLRIPRRNDARPGLERPTAKLRVPPKPAHAIPGFPLAH